MEVLALMAEGRCNADTDRRLRVTEGYGRETRPRAPRRARGSSRRWAEEISWAGEGAMAEPARWVGALKGLDELADGRDPALEEVPDLAAAGRQLQRRVPCARAVPVSATAASGQAAPRPPVPSARSG